jgi:hypothetical protein
MTADKPYTLKDALPVLGVSAMFIAMGWVSLYFFAPETVACERSGADVLCRLSRQVAFVTLRQQHLAGVQAVSLEVNVSERYSIQSPGGATYWLRYHTAAGPVDGSNASGHAETYAMAEDLQRFLENPGERQYDGRLPGSRFATLVMPGVFLFGVLGVVNVMLMTIRTLRRRSP